MSQFFEALQRAERERAAGSGNAYASLTARLAVAAAPAWTDDEMTARRPGPAREAKDAHPPTWRLQAEPALGCRPIDHRIVSLVDPGSFAAEQYRVLRHRVEQLHATGMKTVGVTSAIEGDGKTITAINLAGALAQDPRVRVLLVDADLRRPTVTEWLGILPAAAPDLIEAIVGGRSLADAARPTLHPNLRVLSATEASRLPHEMLSAPAFAALMAEARAAFDYVVVDTPPMVPFHDGRVIAAWVDAFFIVVAAHRTPRRMLAETLNAMEPAKVAGLVFNADDERPSARAYRAVR
jgi:capsular exopolysaccharide synthesis family protein